MLTWDRDFQTVHQGSFINGDNAWFVEGRLNASYNCVDRHAIKTPDKPAIIYEADEPGEGRTITFSELQRDVCKLAWVLKSLGVKKGDAVALYLPMIPEAVVWGFLQKGQEVLPDLWAVPCRCCGSLVKTSKG